MIRSSALKTLLIFLFVLQTVFVHAQTSAITQRFDSLMNYLYSANLFSGRVILQKNNKVIYCGNFDRFSPGNSEYHIGSVTKVFTAMMVYQLIEEGRLSYSTKLKTFFPGIKYADTITIEQMLSHSSGIWDVTDRKEYYATRSEHFNRQAILAMITTHKPAFKPGKDCSYSNSNYILLGFIIEDITGKSFAQNIKERFTDKYRLEHTYQAVNQNDTNLHSYK